METKKVGIERMEKERRKRRRRRREEEESYWRQPSPARRSVSFTERSALSEKQKQALHDRAHPKQQMKMKMTREKLTDFFLQPLLIAPLWSPHTICQPSRDRARMLHHDIPRRPSTSLEALRRAGRHIGALRTL